MPFNNNSGFLYLLTMIIVAFVALSCVFFLVKAYKEGLRRGMNKDKLNKVISSSAIFSIAPSFAILLTVLTLAGNMGLPFPWLRLSVIGAISYEIPAAQNAAAAIIATNPTIYEAASTAMGFSTIAYAMTIGIICGVPFIPFIVPKVRNGMSKIKEKDARWSKILTDALFIGLISSFLGVAISGVTTDRTTNMSIPATSGSITVSCLTFGSSALIMGICAILIKKCKMNWLEAYAIPISMLSSMALAIVFRAVLPQSMFA